MLSVCFLRFAEEEIRCKDVKIEHTRVSGLQISPFCQHIFFSPNTRVEHLHQHVTESLLMNRRSEIKGKFVSFAMSNDVGHKLLLGNNVINGRYKSKSLFKSHLK